MESPLAEIESADASRARSRATRPRYHLVGLSRPDNQAAIKPAFFRVK